MILVGVVLIGSGFYIAGQRIPRAATVTGLGRSFVR